MHEVWALFNTVQDKRLEFLRLINDISSTLFGHIKIHTYTYNLCILSYDYVIKHNFLQKSAPGCSSVKIAVLSHWNWYILNKNKFEILDLLNSYQICLYVQSEQDYAIRTNEKWRVLFSRSKLKQSTCSLSKLSLHILMKYTICNIRYRQRGWFSVESKTRTYHVLVGARKRPMEVEAKREEQVEKRDWDPTPIFGPICKVQYRAEDSNLKIAETSWPPLVEGELQENKKDILRAFDRESEK